MINEIGTTFGAFASTVLLHNDPYGISTDYPYLITALAVTAISQATYHLLSKTPLKEHQSIRRILSLTIIGIGAIELGLEMEMPTKILATQVAFHINMYCLRRMDTYEQAAWIVPSLATIACLTMLIPSYRINAPSDAIPLELSSFLTTPRSHNIATSALSTFLRTNFSSNRFNPTKRQVVSLVTITLIESYFAPQDRFNTLVIAVTSLSHALWIGVENYCKIIPRQSVEQQLIKLVMDHDEENIPESPQILKLIHQLDDQLWKNLSKELTKEQWEKLKPHFQRYQRGIEQNLVKTSYPEIKTYLEVKNLLEKKFA